MLRWTTSGAVASPRTLQIRVQPLYPDRVRAGAPVPTRGLSPEELRANILHFTAGKRGPRSAPCDALVLSGAGVAGREDTGGAIDLARAEGVGRVVLHLGAQDAGALDVDRYRSRVDVLVLPVDPCPESLEGTRAAIERGVAAGLRISANVGLSRAALPHLAEAATRLGAVRPHEVVFTWPFPLGEAGAPPSPGEAAGPLSTAMAALASAGVPALLKGLPSCLCDGCPLRPRRSANRWYVDAEHQLDRALLFFPDVVAFHKDDACRFCRLDADCDGWFLEWLGLPGAPRLTPLE